MTDTQPRHTHEHAPSPETENPGAGSPEVGSPKGDGPDSIDGAPVRVLWLAKGLGPGGMERLLLHHARFGDHARFEYTVAYLRPDKAHLVPEFQSSDVDTHCLNSTRLWDLRWAIRFRRLLKTRRFDVVHAHSPAVAAIARVVSRTVRHAPKLVYTEHNIVGSYDFLTRAANVVTYPLDSATFAVSEQVRGSVPRLLRKGVETLVHGIDVDAVRSELVSRDSTRAELGVGPGDVLIGTVANLRSEKAYPDLFAAARIVLDTCSDVQFVSIGQGHLEDELRAIHAGFDFGRRFQMLGFRPDARRIMAAFDVFVLASHFEGLPVTLMEARALGLPVVVTRVGGLVAHVRNGVDGILVDPGRPDLLAESLAAVAIDPSTRHRLAQASSDCSAAFDARTFTGVLEACYLRLARTIP